MAEPRKITIKLRPVGAKPGGINLKKPTPVAPTPAAPEAPAAPAPVAEAPLEPLEELTELPAETPTPEVAPAAPEVTVAAPTPAAPTVPTAEQAKRQTSRIELPPELTQQPMSAPTENDATIKLKPISQAATATTETPEATVQANKSKTARIALDSVLGGIQANTPLANTTQKTIKLKRSAPKPAATTTSAPMAAVEPSTDASEEKTIKLKKPGGISLKKPGLKTPKAPTAEPSAEPELETLETLDDADLAPVAPMMMAPATEEETKGQKIFTSIAIVAAVASILLTLVLCVKLQSQAASANGSPATGNTLHSLPFTRIF